MTLDVSASTSPVPVQAHGNTGSDETFSVSVPVHTATLTADCVFTFDSASASRYELTLILKQDGTGTRLVTWPGSVKWASGIAPVLSTGANKVDVVTFISPDIGVTWYGMLAGLDLR